MKVTAEKNEKVANMIFASIYPHYLSRLEKNGEDFAPREKVKTGTNNIPIPYE